MLKLLFLLLALSLLLGVCEALSRNDVEEVAEVGSDSSRCLLHCWPFGQVHEGERTLKDGGRHHVGITNLPSFPLFASLPTLPAACRTSRGAGVWVEGRLTAGAALLRLGPDADAASALVLGRRFGAVRGVAHGAVRRAAHVAVRQCHFGLGA